MTEYADFKTTFVRLLGRKDCTSALIDDYVDLAVKRINREVIGDFMEEDEELHADVDGAVTVPSDYKKMLSLYSDADDGGRQTEYAFKRHGDFLKLKGTTGTPSFYTRRAGKWFFIPALDEDAVVNLYSIKDNAVPTDDDVDPASLLLYAKDLLMFGALHLACIGFKDDRAADFDGKYSALRDSINDAYSERAMAEGPHAVEPSTDLEF